MLHVIRAKRALTAVGLALAIPGISTDVAQAANTTTTTFQVMATVVATCVISAEPLAFGVYTGDSLSATSSIAVTCTSTTPWNIGLDAGTAPGATVTTRAMQYGADRLNYGLFKDAGLTSNWGNTPEVDTVSGTGTGLIQITIVYGNVPGNQYPPPGVYVDTITATLTF